MSKTKSCAGKDNFERLNYLYQLSNVMHREGSSTASALYTNLFLNIAKKSVQRIEPDIKRTICKKCHRLVIPGTSARVRIRKKKIVWTCLLCKTSKTFKAAKDYVPWFQKAESVKEVIHFDGT